MASRQLARTDVTLPTKIGDAATLGRGASSRMVDGLEIVMHADGATVLHPGAAVHLVVANKTDRTVGYLTNPETHFALVDPANHTVWTDETCRAANHTATTRATFGAIAPGEHVSVDSAYPGGDACVAPAGNAYLTGGLTVCLNLAPDMTCRGASDERIQATPLAVTIS